MSVSHVDEGTLHAFIDGELPPADMDGVAAHLAHCPACQRRVEEERELIARADRVLALARPPEGDLPTFRRAMPPGRRWQRLRVPLAWAATVVLALGTGILVGRAVSDRAGSPPVGPSLTPLAAADSAAGPRRMASPPARANPAPAARADRAAMPAPRQPSPRVAPAPIATLARDEPTATETIATRAQRALEARRVTRLGDVLVGAPLSLDSARALLGADPVAVPGLAVRAIHRGLMPGYSAVVVIEQVLDPHTTLGVITARPMAVALVSIGVTDAAGAPAAAGKARPADARPTERVGVARERVADSLEALSPEPRVQPAPRSDAPRAGLWFDVRGLLAADSLVALRRRLAPLRP